MPMDTSQMAVMESERGRISFQLVEVRPRRDLVHAVTHDISISGHKFDVKSGAIAALRQADWLADLSPHFVIEIARKFGNPVQMSDRTQDAIPRRERRDDGCREIAISFQIRNLSAQNLI